MAKEKRILIYFISFLLGFFLIMFIGISGVFAATYDTQAVTWYYRKTSDESTELNVVKDVNTPLNIVSGEYMNGFTTRQDHTFEKNLQYIVTYKLKMLYYDPLDGAFRQDTISRLTEYSWVDSDFKLLNTNVNQNKYLCEADICEREFTISQQVLTLNSTGGIRFGVYTTEPKSIGFYSPPYGSINMTLSNTITIEDNSSSTIIDQNNQIIQGQDGINNNITNSTNTITGSITETEDNLNSSIQSSQDNINQNIDDMEQNIIENQQVCSYIDKSNIELDGQVLYVNGNTGNLSSMGITSYIKIDDKSKLIITATTLDAVGLCFYNINKELISCVAENSYSLNDNITIPENTSYFRATIRKATNVPTLKMCVNGNQATNDKLDGIQGALTDSSAPNTSGLENSAGWLPAGPLDSVLNLPLSLFNALTTNLNKSCNPINIPLPYVNKNITLPCINTLYNQIGITSFLSWIGVIVSGLMLYTYLLKLYKWIEDRISLNETHNVDNWGGL